MPAQTVRKDVARDIHAFTGRIVPLMLSYDHEHVELDYTTGRFECAWFRESELSYVVHLAVAGREADDELIFDITTDGDRRAELLEQLSTELHALAA